MDAIDVYVIYTHILYVNDAPYLHTEIVQVELQ